MYMMAKIDVKGAFVQTEMLRPPVYIKCSKKVTGLMVKMFPGLKRYIGSDGLLYFKLLKALYRCVIGSDGLLYFKLLKALYRCVQASKLWFKKLTKVFRCEGNEHSPMDPGVMRQFVRDKRFLLLS